MQIQSAETLGQKSPSVSEIRQGAWQRMLECEYDVAIVGAGVSGAALFRELRSKGYRVLLVDQKDFAGGTSQASGMLVWGGLLYLQSLDLRTVRKLSNARDALLAARDPEVQLATFRYLPLLKGGRSSLWVRAALEAYWWLGSRRRNRPCKETDFTGKDLLQAGRFGASLKYEEACLPESDARLVLEWILAGQGERGRALNHCRVTAGRFASDWVLDVQDTLAGTQGQVRAKFLVNAAGVWADGLAQELGLQTQHQHVLSKGVYLGLPKPAGLQDYLAFEMGEHGDSQTYTPWGPVALWGPTETPVQSVDGSFAPDTNDVRFLLKQANRNLRIQHGPQDIVSLRCGVRPLAVRRGYSSKAYPLSLSRKHRVDLHRTRNAITLFGGKVTSARSMAQEVERKLAPSFANHSHSDSDRSVTQSAYVRPPGRLFPGLQESWVDPVWSAQQEGCASLGDYLRRRTNIAQWVPRLGLGRSGENRAELMELARVFHGVEGAERVVQEWTELADQQDRIINEA